MSPSGKATGGAGKAGRKELVSTFLSLSAWTVGVLMLETEVAEQ